MRNVAPLTEQFQHFLADLKETFWGDVYGKAKGVVQGFLEEESARLRDQYVRCEPRKQPPTRRGPRWRFHGQRLYPGMVRRLEKDLPELLPFFQFPRHRWRKRRTTNVIERCFVEVRRRTRPMVCFVNVESGDRN